MAIPLIIMLLATYIAIGLKVKEYTWRVTVALVLVAFFFPALFYLVW